MNVEDRPLAAHGLKSYRYCGPYGWIMIGATGWADALKEAARSTRVPIEPEQLQRWNGESYVPA